jgi:lipid-A-disaccharide synthase
VGHPLIDAARPTMSKDEAREHFGLNPWRRVVGLLPGSRAQEIHRHLPLLRAAAQHIAWHMPGVQFLLPKAPGVARTQLEASLARSGVTTYIAEGSVYDALQLMEAAVVASGTATLQAALSGVPMAVVYRTSWPTYLASRPLLRIPHIAMVNVVAGRRVVPEFVQHRARPKLIAETIVGLLRDERRAAQMREELKGVGTALGRPGAVDRAADAVMRLLRR